MRLLNGDLEVIQLLIAVLVRSYVCSLSCSVMSDETPWIVACQAPLSVGFSRIENWNKLPFPSLGDLPSPGIELVPPALTGRFFSTEPLGKPQ